LRYNKIGEPNKNCAGIPLNPTYYMRRGSETDSPLKKISIFAVSYPINIQPINDIIKLRAAINL
jgi:hypothetical protein